MIERKHRILIVTAHLTVYTTKSNLPRLSTSV